MSSDLADFLNRPAGALGGIREQVSSEDGGETVVLTRIQDCTPFLERNHFLREHANIWRGEDDDFWHVASIPNMVVEQWMQKGVNVFREADCPKVKALLNGEYRYLKTAPVSV